MSITTKLPIQSSINRTITNRIIFEMFHDGELTLKDHKGAAYGARNVTGQSQTVVFTTRNRKSGGAVVVQQSEWEIACLGEFSAVLGNVDFPYMRGATYKVYDQEKRTDTITVTFARSDAEGATIKIEVLGEQLTQILKIPKPSAEAEARGVRIGFSAAFIGFSEPWVQKEGAGDGWQRIRNLNAGGDLTMTPKWPHAEVPDSLDMYSVL